MFLFFKRFLDLLCATILIVVLSPILLIVTILIKIDSRGPVLFRQTRVGYKAQPFQILKFRTMINRKAHEIDQMKEGLVKANDSRVTKLGHYLRVSSLDELPQLFNVLLGSMSLIGPRPILPEQYKVVPAWYKRRFNVRPGISGLAQVNGRRSISWEEQLILDCEYVDKKGLILDINIIGKTFLVVFLKKDINGGEGKNWRLYMEEWKDK